MEKVTWALWGLCAAKPQAAKNWEQTIDVVDMTLCMAESICVCESINLEDMRHRLSKYINGQNNLAENYGSSADRMFPVAVFLHLKFGENMLLFQSALDDILKASSVTHASLESAIECQLYCGIVSKLLAGRCLHQSVQDSVDMLKKYYHNRKEYARAYKVLASVNSEEDVYLQYFQMDTSGTFRTTLDWATFLLFRYGSWQQCVQKAVSAPVAAPELLAAAVGTLRALMDGPEGIPAEWMQIPEKNRIARCCDGLEKYWDKVMRTEGIGYGCRKEDRWKELRESERKRVESLLPEQ